MWGKIIIPIYRLWLNGLYGLYGPRCPLSSKRPINLISLSLYCAIIGRSTNMAFVHIIYRWPGHISAHSFAFDYLVNQCQYLNCYFIIIMDPVVYGPAMSIFALFVQLLVKKPKPDLGPLQSAVQIFIATGLQFLLQTRNILVIAFSCQYLHQTCLVLWIWSYFSRPNKPLLRYCRSLFCHVRCDWHNNLLLKLGHSHWTTK